MTRRGPAPTRAAVGLAAVVVLALMTFPARPTEAAWSDAEAGIGTVSAATIPAPTALATACTASNVLGSARISITWQLPAGYAVGEAVYKAGTNPLLLEVVLLGSTLTTTGPSGGSYTTTYTGGLLNAALGGTGYLSVSMQRSGWTSSQRLVTASLPALIGTGTCTVT
ncbi:hypothetical protein [Agromyces soli]|uniref:Ig-like domain-containing protein n=1 Tax=Agromyces soli TaxID=659012 RepID=A0ABY4ANP1_9MICO|nr:hypothetical protein [Agromyces soli]UOE24776.1 hypothetical protein MTP13_10405 [Agromyces soli]